MSIERGYMYKPLVIGSLKANLPIIQGGMGVGISLSRLAGTVSSYGGIGVISTAQIGFNDPEFKKDPLKANLKMIGEHIKKARDIAPKGILGVNIMVATQNYPKYVTESIKNGIDLIISGAGLPIDLPQIAKGSKSKLVPIVSSLKSASVILKMWDRKSNTSPDAVIIEGPKAGGHLGFKYDDLCGDKQSLIRQDNDLSNYDQEIKKIISLVKTYEVKYKKTIPVVLAGGINTKEDMEHAFSLGAEGIQVGTKFIPTEECDANINYKLAYLNVDEDNLSIIKSPVGMPGRAIKNDLIKRAEDGRIPVEKCFNCLSTCNPATTPYCITDALISAAHGDAENGLLFSGANIGNVESIGTVKNVLNDFFVNLSW